MPPALRFGMPRDRLDELRALIAQLFGNGEQGAMYIPKPQVLGQQVLYQDAAGTVPVMSDGDPVGLMLDLSGNDNHATQGTSAARPLYRTDGTLHWLEFDGVDDQLEHPLSLNAASTIAASAERLGGIDVGGLFTVTAANTVVKSNLSIREGSSNEWGTYAGNWVGSGVDLLNNPSVVTLTASGGALENNTQTLYTNGVQSAQYVGGYPGDARDRRYLGQEMGNRRAHMKLFGALAVDNVLPSSEQTQVEQYLAKLAGITL